MFDKTIVGKQIKTARKMKGYSQGDLAEKANVSRMMISRYETSVSEIPIEKLQRIAEILDQSISYFFGEELKQDSQETWNEAQKYLDLFKDKIGGQLDLSPREMLAFSLGPNANKDEAIDEAKTIMKNWYIANKLEETTNKTFNQWWGDNTQK